MNHTILGTVGILAAIISALLGAAAITSIQQQQQTAAAYSRDSNDPNSNNNSTDIEKSTTDFKFKQKEKNNCSGFTLCCNTAAESLGLAVAIRPCVE